MNRFFAADSKLMLFLSRLFDILILSMLFLLCCIPVITIGLALCALYYATRKVVIRREGYLIREFFHCIRENFFPGLFSGIILLFVSVLMIANILYASYYWHGLFAVVMMAIYFAILFVAIILTGYIFPILSRFQCKGKTLFSNAVSMAVAHPLETILILLLEIAFYFCVVFSYAAVPILLFFLPVAFAAIQNCILEKIFVTYIEEEEDKNIGTE